MRGTGEGDYPWDPGARPSHSTITNGTVAAPKSHSMMTNATVGAISGSGQKTVTMDYKGGSRTLVIPAGTPLIRIAPGTKALLAVGKPVFIIATKAPAPNALFVVVGRHGTALPLQTVAGVAIHGGVGAGYVRLSSCAFIDNDYTMNLRRT
jgi:hypothetical protein